MKKLLLTLLLLGLSQPLWAVARHDLDQARREVSLDPEAVLAKLPSWQAQAARDPVLQFELKLLEAWALMAIHDDDQSLLDIKTQLNAREASITDPLLRADYALFIAIEEGQNHHNFDVAEPALERALAYCRPLDSIRAQSLCADAAWSAASYYLYTGDQNKARRLIDESSDLAKLASRSDILIELRLLKAVLYRQDKRLGEAVRVLDEAKALAQRHGYEEKLAEAMSRQALVYKSLGRFDEAENQLLEAVNLFQKQDNPFQLAQTFNYLGTLYDEVGQSDQALLQFLNALELEQRQQSVRQLAVARLLFNVGQSYRKLGELDRAKEYLLQAQGEFSRLNSTLYLPHVHYELALVARAQGQPDQALARIQLVQELAGKHDLVSDDLFRDALTLGQAIHEQRHQWQQALDMAKQIIAMPVQSQTKAAITYSVKPAQTTSQPQQDVSQARTLERVLFVLILALLALVIWLTGRHRRAERHELAELRQRQDLHPSSGLANMGAYFKLANNLLKELKLALDIGNLSLAAQPSQPLSAMLIRLPGLTDGYEHLGFQAFRQRSRVLAKRLRDTFADARLLAQPSRDYLLLVLPCSGPGQEEALLRRIKQELDQACHNAGLNTGRLRLGGTYLPLLPHHPRVGDAETLLDILLYALELADSANTKDDAIWLVGQNCTLPSALAAPIRQSLSEALRNGTIKAQGVSFGWLMKELDRQKDANEQDELHCH
ncbi:tetratricopeptide repeat protein [Gallaecimonas sp. GXIMD4217]|uniref:tetratricopeptide repeat protein n=1 Tax=Gallaecimonas sp. GXIMD4217 TaxID=3131927 RepID=UPI00311B2252